jgi:hypothetical protein
MKVRQAYEGRVIEARSSELKDGGWDCEFSIEEHETTGVTETAFYVPGGQQAFSQPQSRKLPTYGNRSGTAAGCSEAGASVRARGSAVRRGARP